MWDCYDVRFYYALVIGRIRIRRVMTMCEVLDRVESRGIQKGEDTILALMNYLLTNNRTEDAKKATEDKAYRNKLLTEVFGNER